MRSQVFLSQRTNETMATNQKSWFRWFSNAVLGGFQESKFQVMNPQAPTLQPARPLASHSGPCFCLANPPIVCHALRTSAREGTCWPRARIATWGSSSHRFPGSSQWHRPTSSARPSSWVMCPETECRNHSGNLPTPFEKATFQKISSNGILVWTCLE